MLPQISKRKNLYLEVTIELAHDGKVLKKLVNDNLEKEQSPKRGNGLACKRPK